MHARTVWFLHQSIGLLVSPLPEMSRFSRLASSSSSSSDDDKDEELFIALQQAHSQYQAMQVPRWGGSVPGRQYVHRDREAGHWRLYNDYFSDAPTYGVNFFRRRFAISQTFLSYSFCCESACFLIIVF